MKVVKLKRYYSVVGWINALSAAVAVTTLGILALIGIIGQSFTVLMPIGIAILAIPVVVVVLGLRERTAFRKQGQKTIATIIGVDRNLTGSALNHVVYQLLCEGIHPVSGLTHLFQSEYLQESAKAALNKMLARSWDAALEGLATLSLQVDVFVRLDDPGKYLVDINSVRPVYVRDDGSQIEQQRRGASTTTAPHASNVVWSTYEKAKVPLTSWNKR